MAIKGKLLTISPVLPSSDLVRDIAWHKKKTGFGVSFKQEGYVVLRRDHLFIHLQWHADTGDDPLLGGSVIKIFVDGIKPLFEEFVERGTVGSDKFNADTPWGTNEFGFYDLNKNAIFIVEDIKD